MYEILAKIIQISSSKKVTTGLKLGISTLKKHISIPKSRKKLKEKLLF